jgi:hypothetical protein
MLVFMLVFVWFSFDVSFKLFMFLCQENIDIRWLASRRYALKMAANSIQI